MGKTLSSNLGFRYYLLSLSFRFDTYKNFKEAKLIHKPVSVKFLKLGRSLTDLLNRQLLITLLLCF